MIELEVTPSRRDLNEMRRIFERVPNAVRIALEDVAKVMRSLVRGRTPVGEKDGGTAKSSWSSISHEARGFSFSTDLPYAIVLEEGLYKGVGPRTIQVQGGIFSRQAPGGMIEPLLEDDALVDRVVDLVVKQLTARL